MNKEMFLQYCQNKFIVLDGATGSNLIKNGMPSGECPEKWILEHKEVLIELQKSYVEAGSNIVYAPTFTANRIKLKEYGLENKQKEMIKELVHISKQAVGDRALVAGDITMTGEQLVPMGTMELEDLITIYKEQIIDMEEAGIDLIVIETMMSLGETRAALIAAKEVTNLPVIVTMTFESDERTLFGTDPKTAGIVLQSLGADAIGVNCSTGPAKMKNIIEILSQVVSVPIIAKPNAGLPSVDSEGNTVYDMNVEEFIDEMKILIEAGASILGGCCGTDATYIAGIKSLIENKEPKKRSVTKKRYLTSERESLTIELDGNFIIIGERINPTGKKQLQEEVRMGSMETVLKFAEEQEQKGAKILDVNMGMSGIDEKEKMLQAILEISNVTNLPLSIDSSHVEVIEQALRYYPGRALVNSVSFEREKMEKLLPIVKKYGAMFILLPLSDEGLPKDIDEKKFIIDSIYNSAVELGMGKEDIIVDGLVTTIGANKLAGKETVETIKYCRQRELATVCGLSNISFGMPERVYVNTAFLTLAIGAGLTMAIANPDQEMLVCTALATDMLLNKEESDIKYIEYASSLSPMEKKTVNKKNVNKEDEKQKNIEEATQEENTKEQLKNAVLKGNRNGIGAITSKALSEGINPQVLLNEILLPAINLVGDLFESKKYFLPQLIASAEAMKNAIEILEPLLMKNIEDENMPIIIIATVEGDIHDIGKNLVALMLKNFGFKVIDLGKDVPNEVVVNAAKENNADIIALSALMTTTMQRMKEVVALVKKEGLATKVMIGGAVITKEYADEIEADGYSKDAADAVKLAKRLLGIMNQE